MNIDWRSLSVDGPELDYYGVTVENGRVKNEKVYYALDKLAAETGNPVIDGLARAEKIAAFSYGMDAFAVEKFDYDIKPECLKAVFGALDGAFGFFSCEKVETLLALIDAHGIETDGIILGVKKSKSGIIGLCVYVKTDARAAGKDMTAFFRAASQSFGAKIEALRDIPQGDGCRMRLIAADFTRDGFSLKLYFKFGREYDFSRLVNCFSGTENYAVAADIINSNGFTEGYRIAYRKGKKPSYNFYLKER